MRQQENDEFAQLFEAMLEAALLVDEDGVIVNANGQAEITFRAPRRDLAGRSIDTLLPSAFSPEDVCCPFVGVGATATPSFGTGAVRTDGQPFSAEIRIFRLRRATENLVVVTARDVTSEKDAANELRQMREHLHRLERMEAVSSLAAGVAHDLNNWLSVVLSCTKLALDQLGPNDDSRAGLEDALGAAENAADLTRRLLAVGRLETGSAPLVNLDESLASTEKLLRRLLGNEVRLAVRTGAAGLVHIDPVLLDQIVLNLAVNARDAMPCGGRLIIETDDATLDCAAAKGHFDVAPGPYVRLAITDTGIGMDEATRRRIFEPFFTTKRPGKGTGLGLSTVLGIVQRLGGDIRVKSDVGKGTTFEIFLPRAANHSELAGSSHSPSPESAEADAERVDPTGVRKVCRALRKTG